MSSHRSAILTVPEVTPDVPTSDASANTSGLCFAFLSPFKNTFLPITSLCSQHTYWQVLGYPLINQDITAQGGLGACARPPEQDAQPVSWLRALGPVPMGTLQLRSLSHLGPPDEEPSSGTRCTWEGGQTPSFPSGCSER